MIDIFQSRRNYNEECRWWTRNDSDEFESDELIMKRVPSGIFQAREINPQSYRNNIIGGTFMFDSSHVTIKSPDDCSAMKSEDLVEYQGEIWIVVNVQRSKAKIQQTHYAREGNCSHFWYIELRK